VAALLAIGFAWFIWPTPYRAIGPRGMIQINRFTGVRCDVGESCWVEFDWSNWLMGPRSDGGPSPNSTPSASVPWRATEVWISRTPQKQEISCYRQPVRKADGSLYVFRRVVENGEVVYTNCPPNK